MRFILTEKYFGKRDNRPHNICVRSDKLGFFCLYAIFSFFESYALFGDKNENTMYTNSSISTHPTKKITLACYACLSFQFDVAKREV